jgi:predicted DNA-binding transcriptional regulator YafY
MNEISSKFKRQIEILGIAIRNTESLGTNDLTRMYGVERLTIKRDLQDLRSHGIDIHSEGKSGVRLSGKIDVSRLQRIVSSYLALCGVGATIDKASQLLTKKLGIESLNTTVTLQRCIEDSVKVKISYESEQRKEPSDFAVEPLQIFQAGELWRLLAVHNGVIKQFLLTKILSVQPTGERFKKPEQQKIDEIFKHSFLTWTGDEKHTVRLRLSKQVAPRLKSRQLISFETIAENKDGSVDVEGVVNSLDEIAGWIVSFGGNVEALSPFSLKEKTRRLAAGALHVHYSENKKRKNH